MERRILFDLYGSTHKLSLRDKIELFRSLLNSEQNVQECDAKEADSIDISGNNNAFTINNY